ncbi:MAG: lipocalin family protein [Bacteroidetes bacterium]|nr:lipocalin family protein [Bacteroidota bacterium]
MKNSEFKVFTVGIGVALFTLQGCSKYEDGPALSLKTKMGRLVGEWELVDASGYFETGSTIVFEFEDDFDFNMTTTYFDYGIPDTETFKGEWQWTEGKDAVIVDIDGDILLFEILKLTSDELILELNYEDYNTELEFEKQ